MDEMFNDECIKTHNEIRYLHKSPNLVASKRLAEESQEWANFMAENGEFKHSETNGEYGENISMSNTKESGEEVTLKWYKEVFFYKFGQERQEIAKVGHFTQVIWNESVEAGFGRAVSSEGNWYIVGRYIRAGNIIGKFIHNINLYTTGWDNHHLIKKIKESNGYKHHTSHGYYDGKYLLNQGDNSSSDVKDNKYFQKIREKEKENNLNILQKPVQQKLQIPNFEEKDLKEFRKQVLKKHNYYRKLHGVEGLTLNNTLCQMAQKWSLKLKDTHQLNYSNEKYLGNEVGENIAICMDKSLHSCSHLIDKWYEEKKTFVYGCEPKNINEIGHFSQLVWASCRELGVGIATSSTNTFVVCFYFPPGNIKNEFSKNIYPMMQS